MSYTVIHVTGVYRQTGPKRPKYIFFFVVKTRGKQMAGVILWCGDAHSRHEGRKQHDKKNTIRLSRLCLWSDCVFFQLMTPYSLECNFEECQQSLTTHKAHLKTANSCTASRQTQSARGIKTSNAANATVWQKQASRPNEGDRLSWLQHWWQ